MFQSHVKLANGNLIKIKSGDITMKKKMLKFDCDVYFNVDTTKITARCPQKPWEELKVEHKIAACVDHVPTGKPKGITGIRAGFFSASERRIMVWNRRDVPNISQLSFLLDLINHGFL